MSGKVGVVEDCRSTLVRQLITEHNKTVEFLEALKSANPDLVLPDLPRQIIPKGRNQS